MNRKIKIGRDPHSDIRVEQRFDTVSNEHAEIYLQGEELIFSDHSTNGTVINQQKIKGYPVNIYPGDNILLAGVYPLGWDQISRFFPGVNRPTVTRNIHAENARQHPGDDRRTIAWNNQSPRPEGRPIEQYHPGGQPGRATEQYNRRASQPGPPRPDSRPTDYYRESARPPLQRPQAEPAPAPPHAAGHSAQALDAALARWNWGAFLLGWLWAVCHRCYWPLFLFVAALLNAFISLAVPAVGTLGSLLIGMASLGVNIYLGLKGSRLAWDMGCYDSLQHFEAKERTWRNAAFILVGVSVIFILIGMFALVRAVG